MTSRTNSEVTSEISDDVSLPNSPENEGQDSPEWRADIRKGKWKVPPSKWSLKQQVYLKTKGGTADGPWIIIACHEPTDAKDKWRYDVKKEGAATTKTRISDSVIV